MIASITTGSEKQLLPYSVTLANRLHVDLQFIDSFLSNYYFDHDVVVYVTAGSKLKDLENFIFETRDIPYKVHLLVTYEALPKLKDIQSLDICRYFPEAFL